MAGSSIDTVVEEFVLLLVGIAEAMGLVRGLSEEKSQSRDWSPLWDSGRESRNIP